MTIKNGGQILANALRVNGVEQVFGLHGGHLDSFLFGLEDEGIRFIDVRHEAAAVHAADGYARASGVLGVSVVTSGPGVTNAVTGVAVANVDSIPQVIIGGAPPMRDEGRFVLQGGVDQVALMAPVTKLALRVTDVRRIAEYFDQAVRTATRGRPGPVFLEVPIDVLFDRIAEEKVLTFPAVAQVAASLPPAAFVDWVVESLATAKRPVVIAGNGVLFDGAQEAIREFAATHGVPVFANSRAFGVLPTDDPLYGGNVSGINGLAEKPDWVLLAGARASQMTVGSPGKGFIGADTTVIQIDSNPDEIGRNYAVDHAFVGGITEALTAVTDRGASTPDFSTWAQAARQRHLAHESFRTEAEAHETGLHPYWLGAEIAEAAPDGTIFVGDGSETYHWVEPLVRLDRIGQWLGHGYFGCLGVGHPFAMGAKVAHPEAAVIQVVGDGSVGFNIQEFDTMVRHGIPVVTIVNSNLAWGISAHGQDALADRRVGTALPPTDYHAVMQAFGGHGEKVTEHGELGPAIARALESGLPAVINVFTDPGVESPRVRAMMDGIRGNAGIDADEAQVEQPIAIPYYDPIER